MSTTGRKLAAGAALLVGVTGYMAYLGGSSSWQYYLTAEECLRQGPSLVGSRLRVSGTVAPGSLRRPEDRDEARFALAAGKGRVHVVCSASLPDNFAEGREVVVEGRLKKPTVLHADALMTRCASKYQAESDRREEPADGAAREAGS